MYKPKDLLHADSLRWLEQAGHMLVVFLGHGPQLIPSLLIHFRTGLECGHTQTAD